MEYVVTSVFSRNTNIPQFVLLTFRNYFVLLTKWSSLKFLSFFSCTAFKLEATYIWKFCWEWRIILWFCYGNTKWKIGYICISLHKIVLCCSRPWYNLRTSQLICRTPLRFFVMENIILYFSKNDFTLALLHFLLLNDHKNSSSGREKNPFANHRQFLIY